MNQTEICISAYLCHFHWFRWLLQLAARLRLARRPLRGMCLMIRGLLMWVSDRHRLHQPPSEHRQRLGRFFDTTQLAACFMKFKIYQSDWGIAHKIIIWFQFFCQPRRTLDWRHIAWIFKNTNSEKIISIKIFWSKKYFKDFELIYNLGNDKIEKWNEYNLYILNIF